MYLDNCRGVNNADMVINGESYLLRSLARELFVPVLDIGSNVGQWARLLLQYGCRAPIHCFEPDPQSLIQLRSGSWPGCVQIHGTAMGAEASRRMLNISSGSSELSSFYRLPGGQVEKAIAVEVQTVDEFCDQQHLSKVSLVKIDVEGHEVDVIEGARRMLLGGAVEFLQFEYGAGWLQARRQLRDVFDIVAGRGLHVHRIVPWGIETVPEYDGRLEDYRHANYLIVEETGLGTLRDCIGAMDDWRR